MKKLVVLFFATVVSSHSFAEDACEYSKLGALQSTINVLTEVKINKELSDLGTSISLDKYLKTYAIGRVENNSYGMSTYFIAVSIPAAKNFLEDLGARGSLPSVYNYEILVENRAQMDGSYTCGIQSIKSL